MASHQIAIAKASFTASLLRPDPTSVHRDEIASFHTFLERALSHCSAENIQTCKAWLLQYVAASSNRVGGLAKYLVALATSLEPPTQPQPAQPTSAKRRRLHILYLLNDLFHHCKYHLGTTATFSAVSGSLQPHIVDLVGHAAVYDRQKHNRHHKRLDDLLDIWSEHGYFNSELVEKLREVVTNSASLGAPPSTDAAGEADQAKKPGKDAPFVMPSTHGDSSTPFYDLPAGNLIPHIIPNSSISIRSDAIKPLQLQAGPADGTLVKALKGFLCQVDNIYGTDDLIKDDRDADIDELGQSVLRDEITGDILDGETYYGWSRAFCQQMKRGGLEDSRSRSRSRSGTRTNTKRRRYSDSLSDSTTPSRSRSRSVRRRRVDSRDRSRSPRHSRSRESSYTPREPSPTHFPPSHQPQPQPQPTPAPMNSFPPPHNPSGHGHYPQPPMGPNGSFVPPPPPTYGAWPPPPPPMPAMPYPPPGSGAPPSAFPPPFNNPPMHMPLGQGQPMPPGQYHFPPPYSGGQHGGPWGPPSQGGRSWR
ncbi:hypothetical protein PENANT_c004G07771 [Penicillium antarcticum]|uniref:CID domain-containing protein n=1 Tax=Penicillium antarcticum TaxID=416450 RepID=A0A1V6QFZ8_9EURO|nr:uncharacterized protein N7508_002527 [Penicillium antarcticum]KAJ5318019.1 hypothetical protein N7508_002527 [Penicillium antarcticum]OQD88134.1 hypothetical protein PENANT_c004G07771 [Penicillium antarcticum]